MCRIFRVLVPALVVVAMPFAPRVDAQESSLSDVAGALNGSEAFVALLLDGQLAEVAADVDWTAGELANTLLTDDSLFVTDAGDLAYADTAPGPGEFTTVEPSPGYASTSTVLTLHSQPAALLTIFLDFDGHVTKNTGWNAGRGDIVSTPFDRDGNPGSLTPAEVTEIEAVWQLVAEDFGPFNVDVTTEDPGTAALKFSGGGDTEYGTRIVVSPTDAWFGDGYGGVAYVGSFKWNTPAFVFSDNLGSFKSVGDASSHESGHFCRCTTTELRRRPTTRDTANGGRSWGTATRVRWPNGRRASTRGPTVRTRTIWRCSPRTSDTGSTITATPPRPRRRSPGPARHQASSAPTMPSMCSPSTSPPARSTPR